MNKKVKNKARFYREQMGLSAVFVAKKANISKSHLSNVENHVRNLSPELAQTLSAIYNVSAHELAGVDLGVPVPATIDQALMATVVGCIHSALDEYKLPMPTNNILGAWITMIYNLSVQSKLNYGQTQEIAKSIVKVSRKDLKPEPLALGEMPKSHKQSG